MEWHGIGITLCVGNKYQQQFQTINFKKPGKSGNAVDNVKGKKTQFNVKSITRLTISDILLKTSIHQIINKFIIKNIMQYKTETLQEALQHTVVHCDSLVFYCK